MVQKSLPIEVIVTFNVDERTVVSPSARNVVQITREFLREQTGAQFPVEGELYGLSNEKLVRVYDDSDNERFVGIYGADRSMIVLSYYDGTVAIREITEDVDDLTEDMLCLWERQSPGIIDFGSVDEMQNRVQIVEEEAEPRL